MIIFSQHAVEKIDSLGLEKDEIIKVVNCGMKWKEENTDKWHTRAFGLEVVFLKENSNIFIITVYEEG